MQDAQFGEGADGGYGSLLISQLLSLRWIGERVFHSLRDFFLTGLAPLLRDVVVVHVGVEACINGRSWFTHNSLHFRHDALLEDIVEHLGILYYVLWLLVRAVFVTLYRGRLASLVLAK